MKGQHRIQCSQVGTVVKQAVFETQSFHDLRDTALAEILQSDNLTVDEMKIIDAVNEWAEVNKVSSAAQGIKTNG